MSVAAAAQSMFLQRSTFVPFSEMVVMQSSQVVFGGASFAPFGPFGGSVVDRRILAVSAT